MHCVHLRGQGFQSVSESCVARGRLLFDPFLLDWLLFDALRFLRGGDLRAFLSTLPMICDRPCLVQCLVLRTARLSILSFSQPFRMPSAISDCRQVALYPLLLAPTARVARALPMDRTTAPRFVQGTPQGLGLLLRYQLKIPFRFLVTNEKNIHRGQHTHRSRQAYSLTHELYNHELSNFSPASLSPATAPLATASLAVRASDHRRPMGACCAPLCVGRHTESKTGNRRNVWWIRRASAVYFGTRSLITPWAICFLPSQCICTPDALIPRFHSAPSRDSVLAVCCDQKPMFTAGVACFFFFLPERLLTADAG